MRTLTIADPAFLAGRVSYLDAVLADAPVGFWPCQDASGGLVDVSGGGRNATETGTGHGYGQAGPAAGFLAVSLTGTSLSGWQVADSDLWSPASHSGAFSWEGWVKSASPTNTNQRFWLAKQRAAAAHEFSGSVAANANKAYGLILDGGDTPYRFTIGTASGSSWNHIVVTWGPSTSAMSIYINGTLASSSPTGGGTIASNGSGLLGIGFRPGLTGAQYATDGSLCMIAIYNSVLSSGRIAAHYAAMV